MKPEKNIVHGSWYEITGVPDDYKGDSGYISLWAKKMKAYDPDGKKADKIANKYRKIKLSEQT